ncbi:DNA cytosine methyltransferase [Sphingobium olei]|uniref:Cytosine-specific methyltransferase n=1 Tax=Sphingobium olei TaxID=420955 RepID=A0ABW3NZC1_9SPHN
MAKARDNFLSNGADRAGKLKVLDLFSGIGGFSLGLERTGGFETVAFCEIEDFPRRVLAKHWPDVPCYDDVRTLTSDRLAADGIAVDVICGGFPCQDLSFAGLGAGLDGERSGLWSEIVRLAGELRPRFIIVENVAALLSRGMGRVLGDLASIGYDAEWHCIPASYIGARHRRDRIWIVAYPELSEGEQRHNADLLWGWAIEAEQAGLGSRHVAHAQCGRLQSRDEQRAWPAAILTSTISGYRGGRELGETWRTEPNVGRVAYGVPDAAHRLKGLGNAVVPQIPELIGHAILASMEGR